MTRAVALSLLLSSSVLAQESPVPTYEWSSSPTNFENSRENFDNTSQGFDNSPLNWGNSRNNWGWSSSVYTDSGLRQGYGKTTPLGVENYFSDDGSRIGYQPKDEE